MRHHTPRRAAVFGIAAILWLGVLFFFSGQSGTDSGQLSAWLTRLLFGWLIDRGKDAVWLEFLLRKTAHGCIFALEGFLVSMSLLSLSFRPAMAAISLILCGLVAVANELHQLLSLERSCEVRDMIIDTSGAAIGISIAIVLLIFLNRQYNKDNR